MSIDYRGNKTRRQARMLALYQDAYNDLLAHLQGGTDKDRQRADGVSTYLNRQLADRTPSNPLHEADEV